MSQASAIIHDNDHINHTTRIAVLDDYQEAALSMADWSPVHEKASVTVFHTHLDDPIQIIERLLPFQVICVMRERTPMTREIMSQLPNLKLIVSTGRRNASIDMEAAKDLGITVAPTGYYGTGAPELTWALLMAIARHIVPENESVRNGDWQQHIGIDLKGKTLGVIGLGNIGSTIAKYARAFEMEVIAWSENLTENKASEHGARLVSKEELFMKSDFITIHLVLSERSKNTVTARELSIMKSTAYFINTSRGPLVNEIDLVTVLKERKIAGAALDVFDREPLDPDHPFRTLKNVLVTPHIGYVTETTYRLFYVDTVKAIMDWLQ